MSADPLGATTSNVAAAVWFPTSVGPRDRVVAWGDATRRRLERLVATSAAGVLRRRTLMLYRGPPGRPWWTAAVPDVRPAPASALPPGYRHGLTFTVPLVQMPRYLRWLHDRFATAGGQLRHRRLRRLEELADVAPVVVNCAGLGARELADDPGVVPIRGQVVRTTNPGLDVSVRDQHHPQGYTYVHPRVADCILGGTLERGVWSTAPDDATTAAILARCRQVVPALGGARVLDVAVGLRPGRARVRLEREERDGIAVVHAYGHSGAGVTLSWGCAAEVADLVLDGAGRDRPGP